MDNYICIGGKKTELTEEQLRQLGIEIPKASPFKRGKLNDAYYCINTYGSIQKCYETSDSLDKYAFNIANYCTDKSLMEQRALHETLNRLLWRYSMEHDGNKIEWNNANKKKYSIWYDFNHNTFKTDWVLGYYSIGVPHFYTEEIAKAAIREIVGPFMKEHPEFKW